jgi:L-malate glycosyltransferase
MIKVLLLSDPSSPHTIKWARSLSSSGVEVCIFGLNPCPHEAYASFPNIRIHSLGLNADIFLTGQASLNKIYYLKALTKIKQIIKDFKPDILHAHYATSYGLLGALSGFKPFILSVWGTDIFDFPNVSLLHRCILRFNLMRADNILSTSYAMAKETQKYTRKAIEVTPFGIDLNIFKPTSVDSFFSPKDIVIGTIKTLAETYGIEYLIRAFYILRSNYPQMPLKLLIVGGGELEQKLKSITRELGLGSCVIFTGKVSYDDVPKYHNMISVFVSVSNSESFGVAIIEASACERPVVVSRVGGLIEVVEDGVSGIVVPPRNVAATAKAIEHLILNEDLRKKMGSAGRKRVALMYDWNANVSHMMGIYKNILAK